MISRSMFNQCITHVLIQYIHPSTFTYKFGMCVLCSTMCIECFSLKKAFDCRKGFKDDLKSINTKDKKCTY